MTQLRAMLDNDDTPEEIRRLLDGPGKPREILQRLVDSGVIPDPEESMAELIEEFEGLLEPDSSPLDAELAGAEFLALVRQDLDEDQATEALVTVVEQLVERYPAEVALVLLRSVAAVSAQEQLRSAASARADELVAGGLSDPAWVATIGRPSVGACYGYSDSVERTIVAEFAYGDEAHALAVHIDQSLGGGIRDIWVTDRPEELRADFRDEPEEYGKEVRYDLATAHAFLERALREEPCPVEPDEVDDVEIHLDLLKQRMALLAAAS